MYDNFVNMIFLLQGKTLWYDIDGEHFEAMPIEVSLLKKRLKFYISPAEMS